MDSATPMGFRGKRIFWVLALGLAAADLLTKWAAFEAVRTQGVPSYLHGGEKAITVIPGFFYLTEVWNPGGIWGIAQEGWKSTALVVFRSVAVPGLVLLAARTPAIERRLVVALSMFCAGAIGNLYDNLIHRKGVRDFLDFFLIGESGYHYPTFNVADACIVCAALLVALDAVLPRPTPQTSQA